ncbi:MAG: hypothetical protein RR336_07450, partial [Oscillospiraceae bacterium]
SRRFGYKKQTNGLLMWAGSYLSRTSESVFSWGVVAEMTENLMERGEYKIKLGLQNAPMMAEQLALFDVGGSAPVYEAPDNQTSFPLFPAQAVPQAVIDRALYTAGNESGSAYRVAAFYMRERPEEENAAFLRREFGTENGRGIEHEGRKYAVWFQEDGIHLAQGNSVRTGYARTTVSWEQASARILELLNAGTYLSPAELAQAQDKALGYMAEALLMTARDLTEEARATGLFAQTLAIHDQPKGYPDLEKDVVSYAKSGNGLETFAQEYHTFLDAYAKDRSILRWRLSDYNTHRIGVMLDGVEYPKRNFVAQPDFLRQCKMFITQDEIDHFFLGGGADSKLAVYAHFCYPHTPEERQKFIKNYFGEYSGGACDGYDHTKTHMGLTYEREYEWKKYDTVQLTIPQVIKQYERLIAQKQFPGEEAIAKIPEYEAGQLARTIYHGFYNAPDSIPRPYPTEKDFYDAVSIIQEQLSDPTKMQEILNALTGLLDSSDEGDRYYDLRKSAKEQLTEYVGGTYSLFCHRHDGLRLRPEAESNFIRQVEADVAAIAADAPAPYARFHVIETDSGYGVWDDIREEIYVDAEGVTEDFDSEWQAEAYLEQVKKAVSDQESAEWLYVEQAKTASAESQPMQTDAQFAEENLVPGETIFEMDGRMFMVDRVNLEREAVSFQDITFAQKVGFPIFRTESISFVRARFEEQQPAVEPAAKEEPLRLPPVPRKKERTDDAVPLAPDGINYHITDDALGAGTPSERYANNVAAIRLLHEMESESRAATGSEQSVLAQYVGWGGLADCFDPKNSRYAELKSLLS